MRTRADPALQDLRYRRLFKLLNDAAENGLVCPTNNAIAEFLGVKSGAAGGYYLIKLEQQGRIEVLRGNNARVITIVATGKHTAGEIAKLHWRLRPTSPIAPRPRHPRIRFQSGDTYLSDEAIQRRAQQVAAEEAFITSITVSRDPCPRCGVRGDIPHTHRSRT